MRIPRRLVLRGMKCLKTPTTTDTKEHAGKLVRIHPLNKTKKPVI